MKKIVDICGDLFYLDDGKLHNEEGPSIIYKSGVLWWMYDGMLHRDNGPAIIGNKEEYWLNGEMADKNELKNIKRNKWIDNFSH